MKVEKVEKTINGKVVCGYRIGGVVYVNTTPHEIFFMNPEGKEEPIVLPPSGLLVNAKPVEKVVGVRDGITFVRTEFVGDAEMGAILSALEESFSEGGRRPVIIGSIITAQAYPSRVVALCPAPGFERAPPSEKRMLLNKFTVF